MKAPKIRFKGFEGAWEEFKIKNLIIEYIEKTTKNNEFPILSSTKSWIYFQTEYFNNQAASWDTTWYKRIPFWYFTYRSMSDTGSFTFNIQNIAKEWIVSPAYPVFSLKEWNDKIFFRNQVNTSLKIKNQILLLKEWGTRFALPFTKFSELKVINPKQKEQEKIWSLFEQLDSHISKNQQKLEKLKNLKQSFLQKLFPKAWATVPELRFKGFEGVWEERKLGELAEWFEYWLNAPATTFDWNNKYIRITDIDETSNLFLQTDITSPNCNLIQADKYKLSYWDILFARTWASVWKSYMYLNSDGLVYYAWFLIKASVKEKKNTKFIFLNTLTEKYKKYIKITSQRSWQPWVNAIEYSLYKFMTTSVPEQEKIWAFFEKLDTQITQQTQKIEKLKNIKQSLLEKMFI